MTEQGAESNDRDQQEQPIEPLLPSSGESTDESTGQTQTDASQQALFDVALDKRLTELPLNKIQSHILHGWGQTEKELSPYFYHARLKMRRQGSRNDIRRVSGKPDEGFAAWCDEHGIPRTTANRWADNYAVLIGVKPPKPAIETATSTQNGQSSTPEGQGSSAAEQMPVPLISHNDYPDPLKLTLETTVGERVRYEQAIGELAGLLGMDSEKDVILAVVLADFTDQEWKEFKSGMSEIAASYRTTRYKGTILAMLRAALQEVRRARIAA